MKNCVDELISAFGESRVALGVPMSEHTSARVGGPAAAMIFPESADEIITAIKICRERDFPFFVIGNGTNLIARDEGYAGLIIKISGDGKIRQISENTLLAPAGAPLSELCAFAAERSLSGLEFASGIPGTVGGAVCMNAGAYGGEIKNAIISAAVICPDLSVKTLSRDELGFGYRESVIKDGYIVTEASFELRGGERDKIKTLMNELDEKRKLSQPLEYPSAGSAFKRPDGNYAGKLVAEAGLRGFRIGGAMVSDKHCGFIVNAGNATAKDFLDLIAHIQAAVYEKSGVRLVPEPRIL